MKMAGIKYERTCTKIKDDGYRCGKIFFSIGKGNASNNMFCEDCRHKSSHKLERAGLVRSHNVYTKSGNDEKIRDFVINLMTTYEDDKKTIAELKKVIDSLSNRLVLLESGTEQAAENLKLGIDIEKLKRQNTINEKKIKSLKKLIHRNNPKHTISSKDSR